MLTADGDDRDFGPAEEGTAGLKTGMQRAWYAHMTGLRASYNRHKADAPTLADPRIELLLDPLKSDHAHNATNWAIPNEIEILLVRLKKGGDLEVALDSAFTTAEAIAVPSVAVLALRRKEAKDEAEKQAILAKLLRDTHNRYAARRSERTARRQAALRLARLGLGLTGAVVAVLIGLGYGLILGDGTALGYHLLAKYNLCVTTFFGFLGAYLSRLIAFQSGAAKLSYEDLENGYDWHFLLVRLLVGGLSALVVYIVIAGRLIGGDLFPDPGPLANGGFGTLWQDFEKDGYTGPTANFAKLIIWCFIAGFSERFLPDHLSALEAKSKT